MPNIVLFIVFQKLDWKYKKKVRLVCKRFNELIFKYFVTVDQNLKLILSMEDMLKDFRPINGIKLGASSIFNTAAWIGKFMGDIPFSIRRTEIKCPANTFVDGIGMISSEKYGFPKVLAIFPEFGVYFPGSIPSMKKGAVKISYGRAVKQKTQILLSARTEDIKFPENITALIVDIAGTSCVVLTI